ncbi:MAG: DUF3078 domain-containing protein [Bacteroidales bacterium]|nr:DUF3078 domain-containing protein [Bacteroidales bacterium]
MSSNIYRFTLTIIALLIADLCQGQLLRQRVSLDNDSTELSNADSLLMFFGSPQDPWQPITGDDVAMRSVLPFEVIFIPQSKSITYNPTNTSRQKLEQYQNMLNAQSHTTMLTSSNDPLEDIRYNYTVNHPEKVKYTWRQIPDPDKNIREGRRIRRDKKADLERAATLISFDRNDDYTATGFKQLPKEEPSPWTAAGQENLQISQLFLENWAKGGESSMSLVSDFRYNAKYKKGKHEWENNITHKMGVTHTSTLGTRVSNDEFNASSKYGFKAVNNWFYSFQNTFKTQMFRNYAASDKNKEKPKSTLLSPAYIQFIFGMDYKKENLSILLSPYTAIITVVADTSTIDQTTFKIPKNKKSNTVDGFSISVNWKKNITRDILYTTKGEVFYEYFEKHGQKRLDWENIIDLQFNRFLSTRFIFELRYYDNESKKFQVKENINIAFKYTF